MKNYVVKFSYAGGNATLSIRCRTEMEVGTSIRMYGPENLLCIEERAI